MNFATGLRLGKPGMGLILGECPVGEEVQGLMHRHSTSGENPDLPNEGPKDTVKKA